MRAHAIRGHGTHQLLNWGTLRKSLEAAALLIGAILLTATLMGLLLTVITNFFGSTYPNVY